MYCSGSGTPLGGDHRGRLLEAQPVSIPRGARTKGTSARGQEEGARRATTAERLAEGGPALREVPP